ncbi:MAG TPA: DinB family protein [Tepidisphaeraceae bacterium]|jgi:uncharacterized damage-inducible protein DinB
MPSHSTSAKDFAFLDVDREIRITRRVLERLPEDRFSWKVHAKSMSLGRLAMHVANIFQWAMDTVERDGFDMAGPPPPMRNDPAGLDDLLKTFDEKSAAFKSALARADDAALAGPWSLRKGTQVLFSNSRASVLRIWCLNHLVHHRAQLCVYLRILNVPVPAVYFNSADEPDWVFE